MYYVKRVGLTLIAFWIKFEKIIKINIKLHQTIAKKSKKLIFCFSFLKA